MNDQTIDPDALETFSRMFADCDREQTQCLADLANAQLVGEEMVEDPTWKDLIVRPRDAARAPVLRAMTAAAEARGAVSDEQRAIDMMPLIGEGTYISWPPQAG